jgi:hypothetical protein
VSQENAKESLNEGDSSVLSVRKSTVYRNQTRRRESMHLYVAAPYSAPTNEEKSANLQKTLVVIQGLLNHGHTVVCPQTTMLGLIDEMDVEERDRICRHMQQRCDALVLANQTEESVGCRKAIIYADREGMPVYHISGDDIPPLHLTEQRCPVQCDAFMSAIMNLYRTHLKKNADYSPSNILGTGKVGVVVRMWDKMARIMNLSGFNLKVETCEMQDSREAQNEALEDSFLDMSCYAIIAKLLADGKWGK